MSHPLIFLCISTFFKGEAFLRACKAAGNTVYLITRKALENEAWPREAIDEFYYIESDANTPENLAHLERGLAWLLRSRKVDRIVALDDFDVEKAAFLREQFRIPGMGQTTARYFRDKLAMRMKAEDAGLPAPPFSALHHDGDIHHYLNRTAPPWVIKPRSEASAAGIKKVHTAEEAWAQLEKLGEERHLFLIEQFKPGDVYHADSLAHEGEVVFCRGSKYLNTPLEVAHGGGVFRTNTLPFGSEEETALRQFNAEVMRAFGMRSSASHTEFIRSREDGTFYFLETSARVGGAHIAEMIEYSSGINLWAEWARLEDASARKIPYTLPPVRDDYAGLLVSLARFKEPDTSAFDDPELVWRLRKDHHVGFIVRSHRQERVLELLDDYTRRVFNDFHATAPAKEKLSGN